MIHVSNGRISKRHGWMDEWLDGWMVRWIDGWKEGRKDGRTDGSDRDTTWTNQVDFFN